MGDLIVGQGQTVKTDTSPALPGLNLSNLTASKVVVSDAGKNLVSGANSDTQIASAIKYVDAGDLASPTKGLADFTRDDGHHPLDLSALLPAGTVAINVYLCIKASGGGYGINIKQNGFSNANNILQVIAQAANVYTSSSGVLGVGSTRVLDYATFGGPNISDLIFVLKGYWIPI